MRHLARHESLEEKRAELAIRLGRPVWVASCQRKSGTLYRYPGMESYVKVRESELWLSRLWDRGRCVKREPQEGGDHFYFDLEPAPFLYLVVPVLTGEEVSFREVGLNPGLPSSRTLDWDDACPLRLAPFRVQARQTRGRRLKDVVRFACSEPVASPDVRQDTWHTKRLEGLEFDVIQAPGHYAGHSLWTLEDVNRMARVRCAPGPCVVCRGTSGETVHLAPLFQGQTVYPSGHICRACTAEAFRAWQALLDAES